MRTKLEGARYRFNLQNPEQAKFVAAVDRFDLVRDKYDKPVIRWDSSAVCRLNFDAFRKHLPRGTVPEEVSPTEWVMLIQAVDKAFPELIDGIMRDA
jgi:hypothetical protein